MMVRGVRELLTIVFLPIPCGLSLFVILHWFGVLIFAFYLDFLFCVSCLLRLCKRLGSACVRWGRWWWTIAARFLYIRETFMRLIVTVMMP